MPDSIEVNCGTGQVTATDEKGKVIVIETARPLELQSGDDAIAAREAAAALLAAGADGEPVSLQEVCAAVCLLLGAPRNR